jgi:hypothetical protein
MAAHSYRYTTDVSPDLGELAEILDDVNFRSNDSLMVTQFDPIRVLLHLVNQHLSALAK